MRNPGGAQFSWATCLKSRVSPRLRLFCFPYVGGGTQIFREWPNGVAEDIEVWAVQLPGAGAADGGGADRPAVWAEIMLNLAQALAALRSYDAAFQHFENAARGYRSVGLYEKSADALAQATRLRQKTADAKLRVISRSRDLRIIN